MTTTPHGPRHGGAPDAGSAGRGSAGRRSFAGGDGRSALPEMPERLARRRRMLAWSAPLLGLALVAGPFLLGVALADDHHRDTAAEDPAAAIDGFAALADDTRFGPTPWIAVYNEGTSALMADQAATAVTVLTEALDLVPEGTTGEDDEADPETPECLVRRNLSLSYEALAIEAAADEDLAMVEEHLVDALDALGPCTTNPPEEDPPESPSESPSESESESEEQSSESPSESESEEPSDSGSDGESGDPSEDPSTGPDQESDQGEDGNPNDEIQRRQNDRLDENREAQEEQSAGGESSDGGGDDGEEETTSMTPQEQELASRNAEAEEERRQQEQREGGGYGGGQNW